MKSSIAGPALRLAFNVRYLADVLVVIDAPGAGLLTRMGKKTRKHLKHVKAIGSFAMQQALLRAMIDALMKQLYQAQDHLTAHLLKARCVLLSLVQRWHLTSSQRVVNAVPVWHDEQHQVLWHLTVGVPPVASTLA